MQRINTDDGRYHAGNPSTGTKGTIVTADAMNALQEEMAGFIEAAGIALKADDNGQLLKALYALLKKAGSVNAYSIASLPKDNVGPVVVIEVSEVWTWSASQYFTGYRSPLCGRPLDGHTTTPLISEVDAVGGTLSKTSYAALWGYAQENGLVVATASWVAGMHKFVDLGGDNFRCPDLRNQFRRYTGTDADTANARTLGTRQSAALAKHSHTLTMFPSSTVFPAGNYSAVMQTPGDSPSSATNDAGGSETRPVNTAYAPRIHV